MTVNITDPIFHNEDAAQAHCEASRWAGEPNCPYCGSTRIARLAGKTQAVYFLCHDCRDKFTVRTGSIMERSHVPLHKWLLAFHLLAASKKGMSAKQMERMLGVTYKTAWFLCHRIREAMSGNNAPLGGPNGVVEADETFVGGKQRNRATRAVKPKKAVVALVCREGHARSFHVANVNAKTLRPLIVTNVDRASHLMTDENMVYTRVGREFAGHTSVIHSRDEYVRMGGFAHSNTAENFFSIFKRGVIGTYHHMSEAHLGRYCREFDFRYNTRDMTDGERAALALKGGVGKRLTYRRPAALAA
ncbi:MAG: IS1595 family transposase [Sphingomicrobium sp.]